VYETLSIFIYQRSNSVVPRPATVNADKLRAILRVEAQSLQRLMAEAVDDVISTDEEPSSAVSCRFCSFTTSVQSLARRHESITELLLHYRHHEELLNTGGELVYNDPCCTVTSGVCPPPTPTYVQTLAPVAPRIFKTYEIINHSISLVWLPLKSGTTYLTLYDLATQLPHL